MLVIWDCDGVLVDSEVHVNGAFVKELEKYGIQISYDQSLKEFTGLSAKHAYEILGTRRNKAFSTQEIDSIQDVIHKELALRVQAINGISNILKALQDWNISFCVASNGTPEHIHSVLDATNLLPFFEPDTIFSASMVAHGKPAPELFLHAAHSMNTQPTDCIVIEDSTAGIQAAKAAGMEYIAFLGAQHAQYDWYQEKVMQENPLNLCQTMNEVHSILEKKISQKASSLISFLKGRT